MAMYCLPNLYLLADSCIVLAELVIEYKNLRIPQSYSEAFDILGENKILEQIIIKYKGLFIDFLCVVSDEAEYIRDWLLTYYEETKLASRV